MHIYIYIEKERKKYMGTKMIKSHMLTELRHHHMHERIKMHKNEAGRTEGESQPDVQVS